MICLKPTEEQIAEAKADAKKMGILPNSFTYGRGNGIGMLGEIIATEWLSAERVRPPVYSHDIVLNGITYDVKTKKCGGKPLPEYTASVIAKDGKNNIKADRLLFARVLDDWSVIYLCGWLTTRQFARRSELIKAGTREGGFLHRVDGFHVPISKLNPMEDLLNL